MLPAADPEAEQSSPKGIEADYSDTHETEVTDFLDGIVFGIEYVDSSGSETRRTITAHSIAVKGQRVYLDAVCHGRQAFRRFRVDRIASIISADGEVFEPMVFFQEIGIDRRVQGALGRPAAGEVPPDSPAQTHASLQSTPDPNAHSVAISPGVAQRKLVRDQIRLLAALARADGRMAKEEVDAIVEYICIECDEAGVEFGESDIDALSAYVKRLRPTSDKLEESLNRLFGDSKMRRHPEQYKRLLRALRNVADADSEFHENEFTFLLEFEGWIGGVERGNR